MSTVVEIKPVPRRVSDELIWLRPEPGRSKARLSREKIAAAAIAIADAKGFEAVSMRRIAAQLGKSPMSLYHYIRTKGDLVALMDDGLMGEILVPDRELPADWRAAMIAIALRTRGLFAQHPWALLSMRGAPPGPNAMRHFEQSLAALANAPFTVDGKLELSKLVGDFVFGHALRAAEVQAMEPAMIRAAEEMGRRQIATGAYPHTAALLARRKPGDRQAYLAWMVDERRFVRGLKILLDGAPRHLRRGGSRRR
jgi:AcrR family transcriptional regulator